MPADSHRPTGAGSAISRWVARHRVAADFVALAAAAGMTFLLLRVGPMTDDAPTERLVLEETTFNALPGWQADDHAAALASFIFIIPNTERNEAGLEKIPRLIARQRLAQFRHQIAYRVQITGGQGEARVATQAPFTRQTADGRRCRAIRRGIFSSPASFRSVCGMITMIRDWSPDITNPK